VLRVITAISRSALCMHEHEQEHEHGLLDRVYDVYVYVKYVLTYADMWW
jgi:hypothetical protein